MAVAPHDAEPHPGCLARLLAEGDARPRAGLMSADVGDNLTPVVDRYFGAIPAPATVTEGWEPAGYPHGTLMLARTACLREVGLFDERYFAYVEEAELAVRAAARGWEIGVVRGADVRNGGIGNRLALIDYLQTRNTLLMVREHSGLYHASIRLVIACWHMTAGAFSPRFRGGPTGCRGPAAGGHRLPAGPLRPATGRPLPRGGLSGADLVRPARSRRRPPPAGSAAGRPTRSPPRRPRSCRRTGWRRATPRARRPHSAHAHSGRRAASSSAQTVRLSGTLNRVIEPMAPSVSVRSIRGA